MDDDQFDEVDFDSSEESEDVDHYEGRSYWENEAYQTVKRLLNEAKIDDIRGVVELPEFDDGSDRRWREEFSTYEEMHSRLMEIYDHEWYAHVPFDGGAIEDSDSYIAVGEMIDYGDLAEFFFRIKPEESEAKSELILLSKQIIRTPEQARLFRVDLDVINNELIAYLANSLLNYASFHRASLRAA